MPPLKDLDATKQVPAPVEYDGVPSYPAAYAREVAPYLWHRNAHLTDVAADGSAILITSRMGHREHLFVVRRAGGQRQQLTFGPFSVAAAAFVPTEDRSSVRLVYMTRGTRNSLHLLDVNTHHSVQLTQTPRKHAGFVVSKDHVYFTHNERNLRDFDLARIPLGGEHKEEALLRGKGFEYPSAISPDGDTLLVQRWVSGADHQVRVIDLKGASATVAEEFDGAQVSAWSQGLWRISHGEGDGMALTSAKRTVQLTDGIGLPLFDHDPRSRTSVWGVTSISGTELRFGNPSASRGGGRVLTVPDDTTVDVLMVRNRRIFAQVSSPQAPTDVVELRVGKQPIPWTRSETSAPPWENPKDQLEHLVVSSFDDHSLPVSLFRTRAPGARPVLIHLRNRPDDAIGVPYSPLTQYLLQVAKVHVLHAHVRGARGYGRTFTQLDDGEHREDAVLDLGHVLDWVADQPALDQSRVALYGAGYGGYLVLATMAQHPGRVQAGVVTSGITSFVKFIEGTHRYKRDLLRTEYGDERTDDMRTYLNGISAVQRASRITGSLFLAYSAEDERFPQDDVQQITQDVRLSGASVWRLTTRRANSNIQLDRQRAEYATLTTLFIEEMLGTRTERKVATGDNPRP